MKRTVRRLSRVLAAPSTSLAVGALLWGAVHALKGLTGVLEDLTDLGEGLEEVGQATEVRQRLPGDSL